MEDTEQPVIKQRVYPTVFSILTPALLLLCFLVPCYPQTGDEASIRAVINAQAEAWNRGDVPGFMKAYEDSPETTFIGATLRKGYAPILERYTLTYTTPERMGTLTFKDLEVRLLTGSCGKTEFAIVTGRFHLERANKGEAQKDDGNFSLVWRKGKQGWKIVLDHTS